MLPEPPVPDADEARDNATFGALLAALSRPGTPISLTRSFHCATRFPDLGRLRAAGVSVTDVYRAHGIADYRRRDTMLYARQPQKWEARLLEQHPEQPVMVMCKTDETPEGAPLGWSEALWAAGRVRFELGGTGDA